MEINSTESLLERFNESQADYLVVFFRLVTSCQLQMNSEFYQNFIEGDLTVKEFCHHEVEPMYRESDHIHIISLTSVLGVGVRINYLDRGGSEEKVNVHDFPEGCENPRIHLLYRPGHYDILYPKGGYDPLATETTVSSSTETTESNNEQAIHHHPNVSSPHQFPASPGPFSPAAAVGSSSNGVSSSNGHPDGPESSEDD